ncbi:MAG: response regulator [Planctomycetes bacterium]|nr:response regulator [Planctomycetota bacterium]
MRALVVDDSGIMRKLVMRSLLESKLAQFMFTEAKDGVEALAAFSANPINMIFVDWNMPNMNGIDFVKEVRKIEKEHVPVVMITTESTMGKIEEALDTAGIDCFIVKPFTTETLQVKLSPLFDKLSEPKKPGGFFSKLASSMT